MKIFKKLFHKNSGKKDDIIQEKEPEDDIIMLTYGKLPLSSLAPDEYKDLAFLVVEDNIDQLNAIGSFLEKYGAAVDYAENGQLGVQLFFADPDKYDIIFMDKQMPVMCGEKAAEQIRFGNREEKQQIPIVGISGDMFQGRGKESVFDYYLQKPFSLERFAYLIRCILKTGGADHVTF